MTDVSVSGLDDILKKLAILPQRVQKNVVVGAIRASAKPIIQEAKALVPKDSKSLSKSIGITKFKTRKKSLVWFSVSPRRGKNWDGFYGRFIEFGTVKMSAKPFMRPAFEKKSAETIKFAKEYMKKRLDKELAKL